MLFLLYRTGCWKWVLSRHEPMEEHIFIFGRHAWPHFQKRSIVPLIAPKIAKWKLSEQNDRIPRTSRLHMTPVPKCKSSMTRQITTTVLCIAWIQQLLGTNAPNMNHSSYMLDGSSSICCWSIQNSNNAIWSTKTSTPYKQYETIFSTIKQHANVHQRLWANKVD